MDRTSYRGVTEHTSFFTLGYSLNLGTCEIARCDSGYDLLAKMEYLTR